MTSIKYPSSHPHLKMHRSVKVWLKHIPWVSIPFHPRPAILVMMVHTNVTYVRVINGFDLSSTTVSPLLVNAIKIYWATLSPLAYPSCLNCHVKSSLHVIVVPPVCPHIIALIQCRFISQFLRKSPSRPGHAIRWQVHIRFVSIIPGYPQSTRLTSSCLNNNFIL